MKLYLTTKYNNQYKDNKLQNCVNRGIKFYRILRVMEQFQKLKTKNVILYCFYLVKFKSNGKIFV